jgi:hypothetical protein
MKHTQEVFAQCEGKVEERAGGQKLVVEDIVPILHIGSAEQYEVTYNENETLSCGFKKHKACDSTITFNSESDAVDDGSVVVAINAYPATGLTHEETMLRLSAAVWPLTIRFQRPLVDDRVLSLLALAEIEDDSLRVQAFKRKMLTGIYLIKHGKRHTTPHMTKLWIDNNHLFWEGKKHGKNGQDDSKGIGLYEMKWVVAGKKAFRDHKSERDAPDQFCFSLVAEDRALDFQVSDHDGEAQTGQAMLVDCFKALVQEVRGSQLFVNEDGNVIRRNKPKSRLRTI